MDVKLTSIFKKAKRHQSSKGVLKLEDHLNVSCQLMLNQRIEFVKVPEASSHLEDLKKRYKPLNRSTNSSAPVSMDASPAASSGRENVSDKDGLPKPKAVLFDDRKLVMRWAKPRPVGAGLNNLGNTCFLNSVMQCLAYTAPLFNHLTGPGHAAQCQKAGFCCLCEMERHLRRVMSGGVIKPIKIVQNLKAIGKHFRLGSQEDAHEFLRYFVDSMQKSCLHGLPAKLDVSSKSTTLVHSIFGGYLRSRVTCLQCLRDSDTYDQLLDLSLDVKTSPSIERALHRAVQPDLLEGANQYACPSCKKLCRAKKSFTIHRLPRVMTLHLKRFSFSSLYGSKLSKVVQYGELLNLRPFTSQPKGAPAMYKLYGVLVHSGLSCHSGHYYCFVRNSNNFWHCMNDSSVSQASLGRVLSQEAYLLFYVQQDPPRSHHFQEAQKSLSQSPNGVRPTGVVIPSPQKDAALGLSSLQQSIQEATCPPSPHLPLKQPGKEATSPHLSLKQPGKEATSPHLSLKQPGKEATSLHLPLRKSDPSSPPPTIATPGKKAKAGAASGFLPRNVVLSDKQKRLGVKVCAAATATTAGGGGKGGPPRRGNPDPSAADSCSSSVGSDPLQSAAEPTRPPSPRPESSCSAGGGGGTTATTSGVSLLSTPDQTVSRTADKATADESAIASSKEKAVQSSKQNQLQSSAPSPVVAKETAQSAKHTPGLGMLPPTLRGDPSKVAVVTPIAHTKPIARVHPSMKPTQSESTEGQRLVDSQEGPEADKWSGEKPEGRSVNDDAQSSSKKPAAVSSGGGGGPEGSRPSDDANQADSPTPHDHPSRHKHKKKHKKRSRSREESRTESRKKNSEESRTESRKKSSEGSRKESGKKNKKEDSRRESGGEGRSGGGELSSDDDESPRKPAAGSRPRAASPSSLRPGEGSSGEPPRKKRKREKKHSSRHSSALEGRDPRGEECSRVEGEGQSRGEVDSRKLSPHKHSVGSESGGGKEKPLPDSHEHSRRSRESRITSDTSDAREREAGGGGKISSKTPSKISSKTPSSSTSFKSPVARSDRACSDDLQGSHEELPTSSPSDGIAKKSRTSDKEDRRESLVEEGDLKSPSKSRPLLPSHSPHTNGTQVDTVTWSESGRGRAAMLSDLRDRRTVLDHLEGHSVHKLGSQVKSWDGSDGFVDSQKLHGDRKRGRSEWDAEFDRGKVKKVKNPPKPDRYENSNPFQAYQNRRNTEVSRKKEEAHRSVHSRSHSHHHHHSHHSHSHSHSQHSSSHHRRHSFGGPPKHGHKHSHHHHGNSSSREQH